MLPLLITAAYADKPSITPAGHWERHPRPQVVKIAGGQEAGAAHIERQDLAWAGHRSPVPHAKLGFCNLSMTVKVVGKRVTAEQSPEVIAVLCDAPQPEDEEESSDEAGYDPVAECKEEHVGTRA